MAATVPCAVDVNAGERPSRRCAHNHVDAGYSGRGDDSAPLGNAVRRESRAGGVAAIRGDRAPSRSNVHGIRPSPTSVGPPGPITASDVSRHGGGGLAAHDSRVSSTTSVRAALDEALRILRDREGEAKILSGGYSLLPLIKLRLAQPALLVDIQAITGLDGITEDDAWLHIGGRATHRQIHDNEIVVDALPDDRTTRRRRHRRPAGPQLGHDRRLGRPRGSRLGLARRAARHQRDDRLPRRRRRARDRWPATSSSTRSRRRSSPPRS